MFVVRAEADRLTWVFATEDISKVEEKFGCSAIGGHRTRPDGSDLKWKQIGVTRFPPRDLKANVKMLRVKSLDAST